MSRSGYSDSGFDSNVCYLWDSVVKSAINGRRGQAFLREMAAALDAMPVKELIADEIVSDNAVCAIGSVALARGVDVSDLDIDDTRSVAERFGIARTLVREIAYANDECGEHQETPAERWTRMRAWVDEQLRAALDGGTP